MTASDVTSMIERFEVIEERLAVSLEGLSAFVHEERFGYIRLRVRGELHPRSGTQLQQSVRLKVTAYDLAERIIGTSTDMFSPKFSMGRFFGFEAFEVEVELPLSQVSKIRVYPKTG